MGIEENYEYFCSRSWDKYIDKLVVIVDGKLVGSSGSKEFQQMMEKIRKKYPGKTPFIAHVPTDSLRI